MARVEIDITVTYAAAGVMRVVDGALVQVNVRDSGDPASVYAAETGGSPITNPLTTVSGRVEGYIAPGRYLLEVSDPLDRFDPYTQPFEASIDGVLVANTQTADYTLALSDTGGLVEINAAGDKVVTVPAEADVPFEVGAVVEIARYGAGAVTLAPDTGVTILSRGDLLAVAHRYGSASLRYRGSDEWVLIGDLA